MKKPVIKGRCGQIVLMAAILTISAVMGCGMRSECEKDNMLFFMKDKYGEEFDYVESYAGQTGKPYTMIRVVSRDHQERQALVRCMEREGKRYYEDNYLSYLLKEELEQKISTLAKQCFGECEIRYKIPDFVFPYEFSTDMTAEEFLKNPRSMPQFFIYPEDKAGQRNDWEERLVDFQKRNVENGYRIKGMLRITDTDELLFSMDEEGNFRYMRWKV